MPLLGNGGGAGEEEEEEAWDPDAKPKRPPLPPPKLGSMAGAAAYEEKRDARARVTFKMSDVTSRMLQGGGTDLVLAHYRTSTLQTILALV